MDFNFDQSQDAQMNRLSSYISGLEARIDELERIQKEHQHGGVDGSAQLYNYPIKLKPGVYFQGRITGGDGSTLVINSGKIKTTTSYHTLDTEAGVALDYLDTIDINNDIRGQILILRLVSSSREVIVRDSVGNIKLDGDFHMTSTIDTLMLVQDGKNWYEVSRGANATASKGFVVLGNEDELTIASGSITPTSSYHSVDTEADAATDDLTTIDATDVDDGTILVLRASSSSRAVVLKDGTGNLQLAGDFSLTHSADTITLIWGGTDWLEVSRSDNSA
jgi:hypothetical protein